MEKCLDTSRHRLALYVEKLKGLSPLDKLNQGYAYAVDSTGATLTSVDQVSVGDSFSVCLRDGRISGKVTGREHQNR